MIRLITPAVVAALLVAMNVTADDKKPAKSHNDAVETYAVTKIEGWTVRISSRYEGHDELRAKVLDEIRAQLRRVTLLVRPEPLAELRKVEIWVEFDYPGRSQYHPGLGWLRANGYIDEKHQTIEIHGKGLLGWQTRPVSTLLHELAHAYHDRVIGFGDERILEAFSNYRKSGKGDKVMRDTGRNSRHYALSDHKEYFAEMTEAYLWVNDYYPFVYGELVEVDPSVAKLLETIWGKRR